MGGQAGLAGSARADQGHEAVTGQQGGDLRRLLLPIDQGRHGGGDPAGGRGQRQGRCPRGSRELHEARQLMAVRHLELPEQRRHVALDGALRDIEPGRDLGVGEVLAEQLEHLSFLPGHAPF
jgi:hypothetical protein